MRKRCAVCGDRTALNVRLAWRRDRDGKTVNVCCACAEAGAVNEDSIDNYTTADTIYREETAGQETGFKSRFSGINYRRLTTGLVGHIYDTMERIGNRCRELDLEFLDISDMGLFFSRLDKKHIEDTLKSFGGDYNEREAYVKDFFKEVQVAEIALEEAENTYL